MKVNTVLNNGIIPMIHGIQEWDMEGRPVREIVLKNSLSVQNKISEMKLKVTGFSAMDEGGSEHKIINFQEGKSITIHGIPSGKHIISNSISSLPAGKYVKLRFHAEPEGGSFLHADRSESPVRNMEFIEFDIEDGLEISGRESSKYILRFDLPPFQSFRFFRQVGRLFHKQGTEKRLQGSFGS